MNKKTKKLAILLVIIPFSLGTTIPYFLIKHGFITSEKIIDTSIVIMFLLIIKIFKEQEGNELVSLTLKESLYSCAGVAAAAIFGGLIFLASMMTGEVAVLTALLISILIKNRTSKKYTNQRIAIISIFLTERKKNNVIIILFYLVAITEFIYYEKDLYAILSIIMLVLLIIHWQLLSYRINKSYYANNAYETLELIEFIVANSKDIDFSDGDNQKSLFPEKETKNVNEAAIKGVKA